jgi:hypothetical protein
MRVGGARREGALRRGPTIRAGECIGDGVCNAAAPSTTSEGPDATGSSADLSGLPGNRRSGRRRGE